MQVGRQLLVRFFFKVACSESQMEVWLPQYKETSLMYVCPTSHRKVELFG